MGGAFVVCQLSSRGQQGPRSQGEWSVAAGMYETRAVSPDLVMLFCLCCAWRDRVLQCMMSLGGVDLRGAAA